MKRDIHRLQRAITESLESRMLLANAAIVKDIMPGPESAVFLDGAGVNGKLFFGANAEVNGDPTGLELWVSNGAASGTTLVKDLNPSGSADPKLFTPGNGVMFFVANDGTTNQVFRSDGLATGTFAVTTLSPADGNIIDVAFVNNRLVFSTLATTTKLWSTGPTGGQTTIGEIYAPNFFATMNNRAYFTGDKPGDTYGMEVWSTDGSSMSQVSAISENSATGFGGGGVAFDGRVWFGADDSTNRDRELYSTSGVSTARADLNSAGSSNPENFCVVGSTLYFTARDAADQQIWKAVGAGGAQRITSQAGTGFDSFRDLTAFNNTLFFASSHTGTRLLYKLSGSAVTRIGSGNVGKNAAQLAVSGGALFFTALDENDVIRVYSTDGTTITPVGGAPGRDAGKLIDVGGVLFYSADDPASGFELYATGTLTPPPPTVALNLKVLTESALDGSSQTFVYEGSTVQFQAVATPKIAGLSYKWDFLGNGKFVPDGTKPSYTYEDGGKPPTRRRVRVKAFYDGKPIAEDFAYVNVINAPPKVKLHTPGLATTLWPMTVTVSATDAGKLDTLTGVVTWGDRTTTPFTIKNGAKITLAHTYFSMPDNGTAHYEVQATVTDKDGNFGHVNNVMGMVSAIQSGGDRILGFVKGVLVGGTSNNDRINVKPALPNTNGITRTVGDGPIEELEVFVNGVSQGVFNLAPSDTLQILGGDGNDRLEIDPSILSHIHLFGGAGNDTLFGGAGDDTLYGNQGTDKLYGRGGKNKVKS